MASMRFDLPMWWISEDVKKSVSLTSAIWTDYSSKIFKRTDCLCPLVGFKIVDLDVVDATLKSKLGSAQKISFFYRQRAQRHTSFDMPLLHCLRLNFVSVLLLPAKMRISSSLAVLVSKKILEYFNCDNQKSFDFRWVWRDGKQAATTRPKRRVVLSASLSFLTRHSSFGNLNSCRL